MNFPDKTVWLHFAATAIGWVLAVDGQSQTLTPGATVSASSTSVAPSSALPVSTSRAVTGLPGSSALEDMTYSAGSTLPQVFAPTRPRTTYTRYPWKRGIIATVFWIGEKPTPRNPTPNNKSSWDQQWERNFGGYDNPKSRDGYKPKGFTPGQNPFYIALPYNDVARGNRTKSSARENIPWFRKHFVRAGRTVLKGRWIAIRRGTRVCYAQWEDVGPFETDNWQYVFGDERPKTKGNGGAGLDVSPAVRDYLGMGSRGTCDWRFVDIEEVPDGPWKTWGANNPFVNMGDRQNESPVERIVKLRELRDEYVQKTEEKAEE